MDTTFHLDFPELPPEQRTLEKVNEIVYQIVEESMDLDIKSRRLIHRACSRAQHLAWKGLFAAAASEICAARAVMVK